MLSKTEDLWSNVTGRSRYGFNHDSTDQNKVPYLNSSPVFESPKDNAKYIFS